MPVKTLTIDGQMITSPSEQTLLDAARDNGIKIPTLCHLDGVGDSRRLPAVPRRDRRQQQARAILPDERSPRA